MAVKGDYPQTEWKGHYQLPLVYVGNPGEHVLHIQLQEILYLKVSNDKVYQPNLFRRVVIVDLIVKKI